VLLKQRRVLTSRRSSVIGCHTTAWVTCDRDVPLAAAVGRTAKTGSAQIELAAVRPDVRSYVCDRSTTARAFTFGRAWLAP
jgi:hypothetical protein